MQPESREPANVLEHFAQELGNALEKRGWKVVTAESCTGGGLAYWITNPKGSSAWFDRGYVTYNDEAKKAMLGVSSDTLNQHTAVSEQTAQEMAEKSLAQSQAQVSIAITGMAGPAGSEKEPVGSVYIGFASPHFKTFVERLQLSGSREYIRKQAILLALEGCLGLIEGRT